jgi:hypothetical protein
MFSGFSKWHGKQLLETAIKQLELSRREKKRGANMNVRNWVSNLGFLS